MKVVKIHKNRGSYFRIVTKESQDKQYAAVLAKAIEIAIALASAQQHRKEIEKQAEK